MMDVTVLAVIVVDGVEMELLESGFAITGRNFNFEEFQDSDMARVGNALNFGDGIARRMAVK